MLLKGFEIQSHQRTAHYLWPFRNGGLTYDAVGQIDPPYPGIGLMMCLTLWGQLLEALPGAGGGGCHSS